MSSVVGCTIAWQSGSLLRTSFLIVRRLESFASKVNFKLSKRVTCRLQNLVVSSNSYLINYLPSKNQLMIPIKFIGLCAGSDRHSLFSLQLKWPCIPCPALMICSPMQRHGISSNKVSILFPLFTPWRMWQMGLALHRSRTPIVVFLGSLHNKAPMVVAVECKLVDVGSNDHRIARFIR